MSRRLKWARILPLVAIVLPLLAEAKIETLSTRNESPSHPLTCSNPADCALNGARFIEYKKKITLPGEADKYSFYMTDIRFVIDAAKSEDIEKFGVVQFIRGCIYESRLQKDGKVQKKVETSRDHFGKQILFQHPEWEVDTDNEDPLYSSYEGASRWALFKWNTNLVDMTPETATYHQDKLSPHGTEFLTDLPGPAVLRDKGDDRRAQNVALEFKTCLFRIEDLPEKLPTPSASHISLEKALWCVEWDHKFEWNFKKSRMTQPKAIDPVCLTPINRMFGSSSIQVK